MSNSSTLWWLAASLMALMCHHKGLELPQNSLEAYTESHVIRDVTFYCPPLFKAITVLWSSLCPVLQIWKRSNVSMYCYWRVRSLSSSMICKSGRYRFVCRRISVEYQVIWPRRHSIQNRLQPTGTHLSISFLHIVFQLVRLDKHRHASSCY